MMSSSQYPEVQLARDYEVTVIPNGEKLLLKCGEHVLVTQTLGACFTLQTESGYLVRMSSEDSASLGLEGKQTELATAG